MNNEQGPQATQTAPQRTLYHMCLSVRGALNQPKRFLRGMCRHDDGRPMTTDEARNALMDELAKGHEVIPLGKECDDFDYKTGCRGHPQ